MTSLMSGSFLNRKSIEAFPAANTPMLPAHILKRPNWFSRSIDDCLSSDWLEKPRPKSTAHWLVIPRTDPRANNDGEDIVVFVILQKRVFGFHRRRHSRPQILSRNSLDSPNERTDSLVLHQSCFPSYFGWRMMGLLGHEAAQWLYISNLKSLEHPSSRSQGHPWQ